MKCKILSCQDVDTYLLDLIPPSVVDALKERFKLYGSIGYFEYNYVDGSIEWISTLTWGTDEDIKAIR